ncbi:MAG TPA: hypothetical protein VGK45_11015 [Thermoanaerobaculia bacterium]
MKRSTALLRIAFALLLLAAVFRIPAAQSATCDSCYNAYSCQPCEDGGHRLCHSLICCGSVTVPTCGDCRLDCILPPSS